MAHWCAPMVFSIGAPMAQWSRRGGSEKGESKYDGRHPELAEAAHADAIARREAAACGKPGPVTCRVPAARRRPSKSKRRAKPSLPPSGDVGLPRLSCAAPNNGRGSRLRLPASKWLAIAQRAPQLNDVYTHDIPPMGVHGSPQIGTRQYRALLIGAEFQQSLAQIFGP
jgi:hypothetical protein